MAFDNFFNNNPLFGPDGINNLTDWFQAQLGVGQIKLNIEDHTDSYIITAELPGVHPENISLARKDDMLLLKAKRDQFVDGKTTTQKLSSTLPVPLDGNLDTVDASYELGVLTITLDKGEIENKDREISIRF